MIIDDIKKIKSDKNELRKFGITIGIVLGLLGGLLWWRGKDSYFILLSISAGFILLGVITPIALKPLQKVWMTLALVLGWVMTRVLLSLMFFLLFFPIGLLARVFGKDFLDEKFDPGAESYWISRDIDEEKEKTTYEKQF